MKVITLTKNLVFFFLALIDFVWHGNKLSKTSKYMMKLFLVYARPYLNCLFLLVL